MTQIKFIENELLDKGEVTRNWALRNYISRLASIVDLLEKRGYRFKVEKINVTSRWGKTYDYKYILVGRP